VPKLLQILVLTSPFALVIACGDDHEHEHCDDDGAYQCTDDDMLQVCTDGAWEDDEDCAAQGLMCHAEMGHCMSMDDTGMDM
jgi:hypothetical protein